MGTHLQAAACPLCSDTFDDPADYRDHLAMVHDLVDDDGTETSLAEEREPEPEPEPVSPLPEAPPMTGHVSPATDEALTRSVDLEVDRRVVPALVVVVAVQLVLALLGVAVVDGRGPSEAVSAETAAASGDAAAPAGTVPPTTVAPVADTRNDQARADAAAPRASDFPAGWTQVDASELEGDGGESATENCTVPNDPTEDASLASAESAFAYENSFAFGGSVILENEADAIRGMAILRQLVDCMGDAIAKDAGSDLDGVNVTHGAFASLGFPTYGDDSIALSMPMSFVGPGGSVPLRVDLLAIRRDRALVMLVTIVGANDFTPAQERSTLSAIAARMAPASI